MKNCSCHYRYNDMNHLPGEQQRDKDERRALLDPTLFVERRVTTTTPAQLCHSHCHHYDKNSISGLVQMMLPFDSPVSVSKDSRPRGRQQQQQQQQRSSWLVRLFLVLVVVASIGMFLVSSFHTTNRHWGWLGLDTTTTTNSNDITNKKRQQQWMSSWFGHLLSWFSQQQGQEQTNHDFGSKHNHNNNDDGLYYRTVQDVPGFFGYSPPSPLVHQNQAQPQVITYDNRSIRINDQPVFLLGGSLHPVRHSPATWQAALDSAVNVGLNLITIYVMWSAHQPYKEYNELDWRLPGSILVCNGTGGRSGATKRTTTATTTANRRKTTLNDSNNDDDCWTLATAIQQAARRRLWVHLRIGPYVCAEYNYGGLPEWVAQPPPPPEQQQLSSNTTTTTTTTMCMRRPNRPWLQAMESYVRAVTRYVSSYNLWAHQGGNILLGQIENELQGEIDIADMEYMVWVTPTGDFVDDYQPGSRRATLQDYANWCGQLAQSVEPHVIWTMCQGLSAPNTIPTFNGVDGSSWLDHPSSDDSGRAVQVDFPALFTEFEGGFQIWGDDAIDPSDYFWGQTARQYAFRAWRWIARGGTHLNYYMLSGGYNRDRMAAAGITNMYASDAPLCSSGERRHPKFDHLQQVHGLIQEFAPMLLSAGTRSLPELVQIKDGNGTWVESSDQTQVFRYSSYEGSSLVFVENVRNESVWARWMVSPRGDNGQEMVTAKLNAWSVSVYDGNQLRMDSSQVEWKSKNYQRFFRRVYLGPPVELTLLPPPDATCQSGIVTKARPMEQTRIMLESKTWSDYVWYSTEWNQTLAYEEPTLVVNTQLANAFVVYLNDHRVGASETHPHAEGSTTLSFPMPPILPGSHRLTLLSESLGYGNAIGVWGASTRAKTKGITGQVYLHDKVSGAIQSLVQDEQEWCTCAGLHTCYSSATEATLGNVAVVRSVWRFPTPLLNEDEHLFVNIRKGRGHLKLNGLDLGRFWNITRKHTGRYSQPNYFLPPDYLLPTGSDENELVLDNVLGGPNNVQLVATHVVPGSPLDLSSMEDEIDFTLACF